MLHLNDITFRMGERTLFDSATLALPDGAKAGLVGRNGSGKTTLFRLISGELAPEHGSISLPRNARIGQVAQEAPGSDIALIDFVLSADRERAALLREAETAGDGHRIAEIQTRLADIGAHSAEARAATILAGLGFDSDEQKRSCASFSGGWRMRVALAAVLFAEPDLLLLDEPTNYLDLEGTLWLQAYVARYPRTVFIISHDRDLLNSSVGLIVHLSQLKLTVYRGGYDNFERQRNEQQALQLKLKKKQDDERRRMQAFIDRFRAKATKARQAQSRLKALERMQPIAAVIAEESVHFDIPAPDTPAPPPLVQMSETDAGYATDAPVLKGLSLRIDEDDRIALLGKNGNGKSTLAKLITGRLEPLSGRVKRHHRLKIAYFAQHQLDELNPEMSAYDHVRELMPEATQAQVRARTARIGLGTEKMNTSAKDLSGGEKARLLLGLAVFQGPHLLVLDEPTNHLDVDAREALAQALLGFPGAVVLISHDRHLIEAVADRLWLVADGKVTPFTGDLDDYRQLVLASERRGDDVAARRRAPGEGTAARRADRRREAARQREALAPMRRQVERIESEIAELGRQIEALDAELASPGLFEADPDRGAGLSRRRAEAVRRRDSLEEDWLARSAELEAAVNAAAE